MLTLSVYNDGPSVPEDWEKSAVGHRHLERADAAEELVWRCVRIGMRKPAAGRRGGFGFGAVRHCVGKAGRIRAREERSRRFAP